MRDRRRFLTVAGRFASTSLVIAASGIEHAIANPTTTGHALEIDGVQVRWRHAPDHFATRLTTPSPGWLALGFNDRATLAGTRFVIADVAAPDVRVCQNGSRSFPITHRSRPRDSRRLFSTRTVAARTDARYSSFA